MPLVNNDRELEELLVDCRHSTKTFLQCFMPERFDREFDEEHEKIFQILDNPTIQKAAIAAPRGVGKTSISSIGFLAKQILFRDDDYIIPLGVNEDAAVELTENLKDELLTNRDILEIFGSIQPTSASDQFSKRAWVTQSGIKVYPRGAGQKVRGRLHRNKRPSLILTDDLEDDELVRNTERVDELIEWFFSAVINSVDRSKGNWRIIVIGTLLGSHTLLRTLLDADDWTTVRLDLCNDQYESLWPSFMPTEKVRDLKDSFQQRGLLDVFYREYRNIPVAREEQGFRPEYYQYYEKEKEEGDFFRDPNMISVVLADPARTMNRGSAMTAVAGLTVNTKTRHIYVRRIVEAQLNPGDLYDQMFTMARDLNALILAPEVTGLNEYITWPIQNEMSQRGKHYIIVEVKPREGKTGPKRSAGLIPLYRQGSVFHHPDQCGPLERYLLEWPRPPRWDVIDAVSGILFVLEEGEQYFDPPEDYDEDEELEDFYRRLEEEEDDLEVPSLI